MGIWRAIWRKSTIAPLAILFALGGYSVPVNAKTMPQLEQRFDALHGQLNDIAKQFEREALEYSGIDLVRKWIDAKVFYDQGSLERAALYLSSLVEVPEFQRSMHYKEALFLLGQALYRTEKYATSQPVFERLLSLFVGGKMRHTSLYYLIDAALKLNQKENIQKYLKQLRNIPSPPARLQYVTGKAHYFLGEHGPAIRRLSGVSAASEVYSHARYYLGVAYTAKGMLNQATIAFQDVLRATRDNQKEIHGRLKSLAHMALGRLALERDDWMGAVDYYQKVPTDDQLYSRSVYELAWAYVNANRYDEAIKAFDVVLLVEDDEARKLRARMDRGRLLIYLKQYENAQEAFEEVNSHFVPIRNELTRFAESNENLELYFRWLIHRYDQQYALEIPLSERAARWVERGVGLDDIVRVLDEVAVQRREINELDKVIDDLKTALNGGDRVNLFPALGDAWYRLLASENGLLTLIGDLFELSNKKHGSKLSKDQREALERLKEEALVLEDSIGSMPLNPQDFRNRIAGAMSHFNELQREAFRVSRTLADLRKEITSIDKYLNDINNQPGESTETEKLADGVEGELQSQKEKMLAYTQELEAVESALNKELAKIGLAGDALKNQRAMKQRLVTVYSSMMEHMVNAVSESRINNLYNRVATDLGRVGSIQEAIDQRLEEVTQELLALVNAESQRVVHFHRSLEGLTTDGESVARDVGHDLFRRANDHLRKTVLYAHLGIIDLAWERKQEVTEKIHRLGAERTEKEKAVQSILTEMMKAPPYRPLTTTLPSGTRPEDQKAPEEESESESEKTDESEQESSEKSDTEENDSASTEGQP